MTRCDKCHSRAIIFQRYSGMRLCAAHFEADVHRKVRESLRRTGLFGRSLRVVVAIDGGFDSSVMLHILKTLFSRRRDIEFAAVTIDEERQSGAQLEGARTAAARARVPLDVLRLHESAIPARLPEHGPQICGLPLSDLKGAILRDAAQKMGGDVLATGHCLDRMAEEVFLRLLEGDLEGLQKLGSLGRQGGWICPMQRIPRREARLYAITHGLMAPHLTKASYEGDILADIRAHLCAFESRHPGTMYSLLRSQERLNARQ